MAVKKGVKKKEHENLSFANVEKVIGLLASTPPITKKEACEILNISYNTARLAKIIQEHQDEIENTKKRRAANRGRAFDEFEMKDVIESFLLGESIKEISDRIFRSTDSVKKVIEEAGVPSRTPGDNYFNATPLPDKCISDSFEIGEYVWSSRHGAIAEIMKLTGTSNEGLKSPVYQIYVYERIDPEKMKIDGKHYEVHLNSEGQLRTMGGFYCAQPAYELGSLRHLVTNHKIDVKKAIR